MNKFIIALAAIACLLMSLLANADDNMRRGKQGFEHKNPVIYMGRHLSKLGVALSEQQKLDIKAIAQQTREDNSVYAGEKQEIRLQMRDLMNMPAWDEEFARQVISSQMENAKALELNKAEAKHAVYQVLTDEQKVALASKEQGQKHRDRNNMRSGKMQARLGKILDLSDEQKSQWSTLQASSQALKSSFRGAMHAHREQVKQVVSADNFDAEAFIALQDSFADSLLEHRVQMTYNKYQSFALLTDEQKEKMQKIKNKMKEKRRF